MNYDAVILSHPKDYNKIRFCFESLHNLDPSPIHVYLVTPDPIDMIGLINIRDIESIPLDISEIKYKRPNWIYQQLIKLYQNFTASDLYMCVDSDLIFNRKLTFSGKTFFISDRDQRHDPYFNFMSDYFNMHNFANYTFINDFMIFDKKICKQMLPELSIFVKDLNDYLQNDKYLFSEFETYGNFVFNNMGGSYTIKPIKQKTFGQYGLWSDQQLEILANLCKTLPIDLFTAHTWT